LVITGSSPPAEQHDDGSFQASESEHVVDASLEGGSVEADTTHDRLKS
jgi:hypothetical protein